MSSATAMAPDLFRPPNPPPVLVKKGIRVSNCSLNRNPGVGVVPLRLQRLTSEFRSLPEPIDRVRRLLDYSSLLTQLTHSARSPQNRVPGCAAQVWLEVQIDELGRTRFGADSDSEITKGFCSCLIYLLDGASPHEVLMVKGEDLTDMNVGLPVRSRVNSWHNVLLGMQDRTRSLLEETHILDFSPPTPHDDTIAKEFIAIRRSKDVHLNLNQSSDDC